MISWRALVIPGVAIVLAESLFRRFAPDSDVLAPPSKIFVGTIGVIADGTIFSATRETLVAVIGGLLLGAVPGGALGVSIGISKFASRMLFPLIEILRPVPAIALMPLALLAFGFGYRMEISIIAFASFWPAIVLSQHAVAEMPSLLLDAGRSLCLSRSSMVFKVILPAAAPRLFSALRFSVGYALIVGVTVEIFSNTQGLGYALMNAQQTLHPDAMLALLLWIGLVGWSLNAGLLKLYGVLYANRSCAEEYQS